MKLPTLKTLLAMNDMERESFHKKFSVPGFYRGRPTHAEDILPTVVHFDTGIPFKVIPAGAFEMGCSEAEERAARSIADPPPITFDKLRPAHTERVGPFLMSITPVLIGEYLWLGGKQLGEWRGWPDHPVAVTLDEAVGLAGKIGCRLPREAEWEYACRATTRTLFPWGDALLPEPELERWLNNSFAGNVPRACNRFGLKGLFTGEWCLDEYRPNYARSTQPIAGEYVIRGGGSCFWPWQNAGEWVWCMSSMRMSSSGLPSERVCGFRLVHEVSSR